MSLRSPMSRVLGLGAAKEGAAHWWAQRLTSVALAVLTLWFVAALLALGRLDYDALHAWITQPVNASLLILLIVALVYHSQLGVQVVLEDYVAHEAWKLATLIANTFLHVALGALGIFSVLRIGFGGGA
jgi:succinate dehydrogenase / fumarate reductase, membrane anchor subunit